MVVWGRKGGGVRHVCGVVGVDFICPVYMWILVTSKDGDEVLSQDPWLCVSWSYSRVTFLDRAQRFHFKVRLRRTINLNDTVVRFLVEDFRRLIFVLHVDMNSALCAVIAFTSQEIC